MYVGTEMMNISENRMKMISFGSRFSVAVL